MFFASVASKGFRFTVSGLESTLVGFMEVLILKVVRQLFDAFLQVLTLNSLTQAGSAAGDGGKRSCICGSENKSAADKLPHFFLENIIANEVAPVKEYFQEPLDILAPLIPRMKCCVRAQIR
jgi:hypothetical protein